MESTLQSPAIPQKYLQGESMREYGSIHINNTTVHDAPWWHNKGTGVRVAVIDSGIDLNNKIFFNKKISGAAVKVTPESSGVTAGEFQDEIGHGTAVASILLGYVPGIELFILKITEGTSFTTRQSNLAMAMEYIINMEDKPDIIHISNGMLLCEDKKELEALIDQLAAQGMIIVSAFDNMGGLSYPASFKNVIGIDTTGEYNKDIQYDFIENSDINIRGCLKKSKLPWIGLEYMIAEGASFTAPIFTAFAARILEQEKTNTAGILRALEEYATRILRNEIKTKACSVPKEFIKKAAVFPINKEIHGLLEYRDMLGFEITGLYDTKYTRNNTRKFLERISCTGISPGFIHEINAGDEFDTFILGHVRELEKLEGQPYTRTVIDFCIKNKKNLVTLDYLPNYAEVEELFRESSLEYWHPYKILFDFAESNSGKLNISSTPTVGVFGTSSKQGKFSLQLKLRKQLAEKGYRVGQIGTEPQSELFGFDAAVPVGLHSPVELDAYSAVCLFNSVIKDVDARGYDIIVMGGQSGIIPYDLRNIRYYTLYQNEILLSNAFDAVILCVNADDDIDFIKRAISYIEAVNRTCVCLLVVFPARKTVSYLTNDFVYTPVASAELQDIRGEFEHKLNRKCCSLNDEYIADYIINYLSSDGMEGQ